LRKQLCADLVLDVEEQELEEFLHQGRIAKTG
jgi:hypothetical protein